MKTFVPIMPHRWMMLPTKMTLKTISSTQKFKFLTSDVARETFQAGQVSCHIGIKEGGDDDDDDDDEDDDDFNYGP